MPILQFDGALAARYKIHALAPQGNPCHAVCRSTAITARSSNPRADAILPMASIRKASSRPANHLLQKSSGLGSDIWLVVGIPCQITSGLGRVTRRAAAVPLQNRPGPGRRIWPVATVAGGLCGAVRTCLVASLSAAACVPREPRLRRGGGRY